MKRKLKGQGGFSLAETLLAVLILLLVSTIVATGMPAAKEAYEKVVIGANAKLLLSTTISSLRNQLVTAQDVQVNGTTITYYSADIGATSRISIQDGSIMLQEYVDVLPTDTNELHSVELRPLVPNKAATSDLKVEYESVEIDSANVIEFTNLTVYRGSGEDKKSMAEVGTLSIRTIKPSPTAAE